MAPAAGHRDPAYAAIAPRRRAMGRGRLAQAPGASALELFERAREGRIKVLWIAATNPAQSMPGQAARALARADFVIVQEAYAGAETLAHADLVLPAATWPEKSGTMTTFGAPHQPRAGRHRAAGRRHARLAAGAGGCAQAGGPHRRARPRCSAIAMKASVRRARQDDGGPGSGLQRAGPDAGARRSAAVAVSRGGAGAPVRWTLSHAGRFLTWATGRPSNPCRRTTRSS